MGIKHIIFDVGGVLVIGRFSFKKYRRYESLSIHEYMAKKFKVDLDHWFDAIDSAYAKSIENKIDGKKAINIIANNLKVSPEKLKVIWVKAYHKLMKKNKKLYKLAFKLKKKGFKIGILSDQWYISDKALLPPRNTNGFNPVIVSNRVGLRKPGEKIYKMLIRECKCKPNEILFVDNREWNLKPAKRIGINVLLFSNNREFIRDMKRLDLL